MPSHQPLVTGGEEDHIAFWIQKAQKYLELRVGKGNVGNITLGIQVVIGLVVVYFAITLWKVITNDPLKGRQKKQTKNKQQNTKGSDQKKGTSAISDNATTAGGGAETPPPGGAASDDETDENIAAQVPARSRKLNEQPCTSVIKGFTRCQMGCSPCGRYVVYGCQKSERLHIHPGKYLRPRLGKELTTKGFLDLDANLQASFAAADSKKAKDSKSKISIGAIGFSEDGAYMVLGECNTDTFHVFAVSDNVKSVTLWWSFKLPKHKMVSTMFDSIAVDNTATNIYGFHMKNCEVEVINRYKGLIGKEKYKLGDATSWCVGGGELLCAAGSYVTDIRLGSLTVNHQTGQPHLERLHLLKPAHRVAAMTCTTKAAVAGTAGDTPSATPLVSTKSYLITMDERGVCQIFDCTDAKTSATLATDPKLVCTFQDKDYDASVTPASKCQGISWTMTGDPHRERLHLAFWNSMDCTVYRQVPGSGLTGKGEMAFSFLQDIHSVHDGEGIRSLCFVNSGLGIMSVSSGHSKGARMWDLQDAALQKE